LAPRLIVKVPAIGQRSIRTDKVRGVAEVISKSGHFLNLELARCNQVWLV
jgi:hypothetical protein